MSVCVCMETNICRCFFFLIVYRLCAVIFKIVLTVTLCVAAQSPSYVRLWTELDSTSARCANEEQDSSSAGSAAVLDQRAAWRFPASLNCRPWGLTDLWWRWCLYEVLFPFLDEYYANSVTRRETVLRLWINRTFFSWVLWTKLCWYLGDLLFTPNCMMIIRFLNHFFSLAATLTVCLVTTTTSETFWGRFFYHADTRVTSCCICQATLPPKHQQVSLLQLRVSWQTMFKEKEKEVKDSLTGGTGAVTKVSFMRLEE